VLLHAIGTSRRGVSAFGGKPRGWCCPNSTRLTLTRSLIDRRSWNQRECPF